MLTCCRLPAVRILVTLQLALLAHATLAACGDRSESDKLCGPKCLLAVCQKLDVQATLDDLVRLSGYDGKTGTSMLGLQSAAEEKGLHAVGMKIAVEDLLTFKGSAIAYLWGNHFAVLERGDTEDKVKVANGSEELASVARDDFKKYYSGFALLVARDASLMPAPRSEDPDLRVESPVWSFGTAYEGDRLEHSFKCRNVGNADLVISEVETSCGGCLTATIGQERVPAREETEVRALLSADQRGGVVRNLYLRSNDPITPVVPLHVVGYVKSGQLRVSPRVVQFDNPRRTETLTRELYVPVHLEDELKVMSATCDSPYITAAVSPSVDKNRPGYMVTATLKSGAPLGEFKGKLTILSNHPKQPNAELPVTATIRGNIDLDRDSFFLGIPKKGETRSAAVTFSTVAKDPLRITKVDNPLPYLTMDVTPKTEGKEYVLTATLKPDAPVGNIKGEVTVHTNDPDQSEIKIPVYAYVEE